MGHANRQWRSDSPFHGEPSNLDRNDWVRGNRLRHFGGGTRKEGRKCQRGILRLWDHQGHDGRGRATGGLRGKRPTTDRWVFRSHDNSLLGAVRLYERRWRRAWLLRWGRSGRRSVRLQFRSRETRTESKEF